MRVIVAGGRDFNDYPMMCTMLDYYLRDLNKKELIIVSGDGPGKWDPELKKYVTVGADKLAIRYAKERGYQYRTYPPNWKKYNRAAGPKRNERMAQNADALVTFPGGKGTDNMLELAKQYGLNIRKVEY